MYHVIAHALPFCCMSIYGKAAFFHSIASLNLAAASSGVGTYLVEGQSGDLGSLQTQKQVPASLHSSTKCGAGHTILALFPSCCRASCVRRVTRAEHEAALTSAKRARIWARAMPSAVGISYVAACVLVL